MREALIAARAALGCENCGGMNGDDMRIADMIDAALAIPTPEPVAPPQQAGVTEAMVEMGAIELAKFHGRDIRTLRAITRNVVAAALSAQGGEAVR
jgi:hypothetical protein